MGRTYQSTVVDAPADDGPSPVSRSDVSDYVGTVRVHAVTDADGREPVAGRHLIRWAAATGAAPPPPAAG